MAWQSRLASSARDLRWKARHGVEDLDRWVERQASEQAARRDADRFAEVERFCLFVGFPRSGSSLVGALLDAHPDMVIAHELGTLHKVQLGYSRAALFAAAMRADRRFAAKGWVNQDDHFEVAGQWQGRVRTLRVIGDKNRANSAVDLTSDPELLDRLRDLVGVPLRLIIPVRHPSDTIARMARRGSTTVLATAARYDSFARPTLAALQAAGADALVVHHEDTVADPIATVRRLAAFLDVDAPEDWVTACADLVLPSPRLARDAVEWSPAERLVVAEMIERYDFLHRYALT